MTEPNGSPSSDDGATRPKKRLTVPVTLVIVGAVIIALIAGGFGGMIGNIITGNPNEPRGASSGSGEGSCNATQVADDVLPTVVKISAGQGGVGSGEIIRKDGYVLTNNHVISGAAKQGGIKVLFSSGKSLDARLVGRDPHSDLAVLKVPTSSDLPTISLGESEKLLVGQPVVALGSPLGLDGSVSSGIVSALGRNVPVPGDNGSRVILAGAIQIDAAINPGNSGGALVNCDGELIGINTAGATVPNESGEAGGGSVGIGFAIPVDLAKHIADQLISTGKAAYPYFGLSIAPIPPAVASKFDITDGLFVESVAKRGPAAKAGLRAGDVITKINGEPANDADVIIRVALKKKVGDKVKVKYLRDGKTATTPVTLGSAGSPAIAQ